MALNDPSKKESNMPSALVIQSEKNSRKELLMERMDPEEQALFLKKMD